MKAVVCCVGFVVLSQRAHNLLDGYDYRSLTYIEYRIKRSIHFPSMLEDYRAIYMPDRYLVVYRNVWRYAMLHGAGMLYLRYAVSEGMLCCKVQICCIRWIYSFNRAVNSQHWVLA